LSHDKLDRIYQYTDNHPRAMLETARFLRRLIPYLRETKAALNSAALPDIPMRTIAPQPRPRWPTELATVDAAHRALVARFPEVDSFPPTELPTNGPPSSDPTSSSRLRETIALTG
jgi:hypothetical protein